ncbi:hypothetical protein B0H17DRAFT_1200726 [Mycena rosella]|uniref:Uncharacterized protein n=1 Tax=Mycena rosella TaxID=1033263 RepID=A0AAD7GF79_MYCRO|nr:hypothetical protein B0H17DRAFT_1200726 [Mycena rosella]
MATQTNRTYSEFFSSGLRAMAGTSYRRSFSGCSLPAVPTAPNALKSSARYNVLRNLARRTRSSSSPTSSFMPSDDTTSSSTTRHRRRSSIVDISSRLFARMTHSVDSWSLTTDPSRQSDNDSCNSPSYEKNHPIIDPFDASPNSSSFFIDCVETPVFVPTSPPRRQRPQSFLLLGEPTKPLLRFPLRRERRNSVQSMPLPCQSRRSSLQYRPPSRDKYDRSWALEEEETPSPTWIEDVEEARDPAANIDWRQFHIDLLSEEQ